MLPKIKELEAIKLKLEEQKREEEREIQEAIEEQTKQFQQLKQDIKEMQKPVSYTHLTLPTILRV